MRLIQSTHKLVKDVAFLLSVDFTILNFIYNHCRAPWLDVFMPLVTKLGNFGAIWIVLALCLLVSRKYRKTGIALCCALVLTVIICNGILKPFVARIRPCDVNKTVKMLIPRPTDFSFPSGHTAMAFASVSTLFFCRRKLWTLIGAGGTHRLFTALPLCTLSIWYIGRDAAWLCFRIFSIQTG